MSKHPMLELTCTLKSWGYPEYPGQTAVQFFETVCDTKKTMWNYVVRFIRIMKMAREQLEIMENKGGLAVVEKIDEVFDELSFLAEVKEATNDQS